MSVLEVLEMVFVDTILGEEIKGMLKLNINEIRRYLEKILPPPTSIVVRYSSEIKKKSGC